MATPSREWRACVPVLAVICALLFSMVGPARGASPAPSDRPLDLTGHWAVAGTSGFDLVQRGTAISGTSMAGISLSGTLTGRHVSFTFWSGPSFARAPTDERGQGTMEVSADGNSLQVTGRNEAGGINALITNMAAIRVQPIISEPSARPTPEDWSPGRPIPHYLAAVDAWMTFHELEWTLWLEIGVRPSSALVWICIEAMYKALGIVLIGGWYGNGGGPIAPPRP